MFVLVKPVGLEHAGTTACSSNAHWLGPRPPGSRTGSVVLSDSSLIW